jgi:hypothetical protein
MGVRANAHWSCPGFTGSSVCASGCRACSARRARGDGPSSGRATPTTSTIRCLSPTFRLEHLFKIQPKKELQGMCRGPVPSPTRANAHRKESLLVGKLVGMCLKMVKTVVFSNRQKSIAMNSKDGMDLQRRARSSIGTGLSDLTALHR